MKLSSRDRLGDVLSYAFMALMFVFFTFPLGKILVKPLSLVFARSTGKDALQLPVRARFELADFVFTFNHQS